MAKINTFSANSLKLLDKDPAAFKLKYEENLFFTPDSSSAKKGQNLHSFLRYYIEGFDVSKIENSLSEEDRAFIQKIKSYKAPLLLKNADKKHIEQPFLIKCRPENTLKPSKDKVLNETKQEPFYLTGRFDAVLETEKGVRIFDWKTINLPKNPECDIQTVVYLYSAQKLYKTEDLSLTYVSLSKDESVSIPYDKDYDYFSAILNIVKKYTG